jgi:hypothetical protein
MVLSVHVALKNKAHLSGNDKLVFGKLVQSSFEFVLIILESGIRCIIERECCPNRLVATRVFLNYGAFEQIEAEEVRYFASRFNNVRPYDLIGLFLTPCRV